jgi:CBS domain containing-hemolysin-like protein
MRRVMESPYSRLPVYRNSLDEVMGALNTKDLVRIYATRGEIPALEQMVRAIPFVPQSLTADRLVRFFQEQRASKAMVVDEHGAVRGIVTMEDVLGELFGDIGDELKEPEPGATTLPDGRVRLPGSMSLDEAEPWIGVRWDGEAATVAGHIVGILGRLPSPHETLTIEGADVTILEMSPQAIRWIAVRPAENETEEATS